MTRKVTLFFLNEVLENAIYLAQENITSNGNTSNNNTLHVHTLQALHKLHYSWLSKYVTLLHRYQLLSGHQLVKVRIFDRGKSNSINKYYIFPPTSFLSL